MVHRTPYTVGHRNIDYAQQGFFSKSKEFFSRKMQLEEVERRN